MNSDIWMTPEEACEFLGPDWSVTEGRGSIIKTNSNGVIIAHRHVFNGTEHPIAQAGKVVFTKRDFEEQLVKALNSGD